MSLPRKAIQAATDKWWWGRDRAISAAAQVDLMAECIEDFLTALPPSIVVDGQVVELEKVLGHLSTVGVDWVGVGRHLLAAAREVEK